MYIVVLQCFNIHTILVFSKYFTTFLYRTQVISIFELNSSDYETAGNDYFIILPPCLAIL